MKTNGLRIGNYVKNKIGSEFCVEYFTKEEITLISPDLRRYTYLTNKVEPIPMTKDWVLRLGFELEYKSDYTKKYTHKNATFGYDWDMASGCNARWYGRYIECKYVHEMQNLYFALTGEEIEIKSPNVAGNP